MKKLGRTLIVFLFVVSSYRVLMAQVVGSVDFAGNSTLDIDSLANHDAHHWQWLSFPGARFALNPSSDDTHAPGEPEHDMPLSLGGWIGAGITKMKGINRIRVGSGEQSIAAADTLISTWYPYKYTYSATYANGALVRTEDFFTDSDGTLVRRIRISAQSNVVLELSGELMTVGAVQWISRSSTLRIADDHSAYALSFLRIANGHSEPIRATPSTAAGKYVIHLQVPAGESEYAICFGESVKPDSAEIAVTRATNACHSQTPAELLDRTKAFIEDALRRVPAPAKWGIHADGNHEVSAEEHRRAYYAAWTFLLEDVVKVLPESSFHYEQVMCGKPSLWNHGEPRAPGMAQWDSLFGIQWLSYLDPHAAWSAFRGLMSLVDTQGAIAGESLPTRKAQTAWILYSLSKDHENLKEVYPEIKRNLLWEEANPRWIYGDHNNPKEKDLEFTSSWIYDAEYAARICKALPGCKDEAMWRHEQQKMVSDSEEWFFRDSAAIHQYYPNNLQTGRTEDAWNAYIAQAMVIDLFPEATQKRLSAYFANRFNPHVQGMGSSSYKYPDVNLIAYGLVNSHSDLARPFIEGVLAESISIGTFAEVITKAPAAEGVQESLFSPMNIIEFTWLLNGCRYDGGSPVAIASSSR